MFFDNINSLWQQPWQRTPRPRFVCALFCSIVAFAFVVVFAHLLTSCVRFFVFLPLQTRMLLYCAVCRLFDCHRCDATQSRTNTQTTTLGTTLATTTTTTAHFLLGNATTTTDSGGGYVHAFVFVCFRLVWLFCFFDSPFRFAF
jgi:hypothetical protein